MEESHADMLRRRIAAYRRALLQGGGMEYIRWILDAIVRDEAALAEIEKRDERRA